MAFPFYSSQSATVLNYLLYCTWNNNCISMGTTTPLTTQGSYQVVKDNFHYSEMVVWAACEPAALL